MMWQTTTYSDGHGAEYHAVILSWDQVRTILGRAHDGSGEDDAALVAYLLAHGAPAWVADAEGWIDEDGWGLIGPGRHECEGCKTPHPYPDELCENCHSSGQYVVCDVCGVWEVYDTLRYRLGDDLGGWCVISEGPETYCPEHRPADLRPGTWDTREEARHPDDE